MYNKNIVYWTHQPNDILPPEIFLAPECILRYVKNFNTNGADNFLKCPVFNAYARKTFNLLSPIDLSLEICDNMIKSNHSEYTNNRNDFFEKLLLIRNIELNLLSVGLIHHAFFTEEPCIMTFNKAFFSNGEFSSNTENIPGQYDISKWFRPVDLAFYVKQKNKPFFIQRNEPVASVNFDFGNNSKIVFKRFEYTKKIHNYSMFKNVIKFSKKDRPKLNDMMDYFYGLFGSSSIRKNLLKEIKNNLLE